MQEHITCARFLTSVFNELIEKPSGICWVAGLRIDFSNYNTDEELPSVGGFVYIACAALTSYVHVMFHFSEKPISKGQMSKVDWHPVAHHDSCWRDDGVQYIVKSSYTQIVKIAESKFKTPLAHLNQYMSLDSLNSMPARETLALGLVKSEKNRKFVINIA